MRSPIPEISATDAAARLEAGAPEDGGPEPLLLDVREVQEFDEFRAPQAVLLPMSEIQARVGELPDRPLLVICRSGSRSLAVTNYLRTLGRDATNVTGGMDAWARAGLPVRTGPAAPGEGKLPTSG